MTVRLYRSTDASAPTLNGSAGSLVTVLDAILINGYGSQSAAGWTIAYTGTNKRVYTMAAGGTGFSLYVDDTGPGAAGAREARVTGFESPSGLGAGTGQFPISGQSTIGIGSLVIRKSTSADTTVRSWRCIADGHTFYLFTYTGDYASPAMAFSFYFGDFFTRSSSDTWNCGILGRTIENSAAAGSGTYYALGPSGQATYVVEPFGQLSLLNTTFMSNIINGHFAARAFTGLGGSQAHGKHTDQAAMGNRNVNNYGSFQQLGCQASWADAGSSLSRGVQWSTEFLYPNPPDSGLDLAPIWINVNGYRRGYYKGFWAPLQHLPLNDGDTFTGTGNLAGKNFIATNVLGIVDAYTGTLGPSQVFIEYSDTWS